ncbi:leucine-rich repeat-containing protein 18 [Oryzias latipes]|uniref:leucine-rich repeat-containing protein 18 n=1 Tax=Oryzias latipes TaxID=8090 RepID=UPI0002A47D8B|nr:leucine-rich repeat-containing protein 18 [Oryzias latipes]XP_020565279.1 leucine-rich repeat-containing protein 18 [Oryzias latipes]XP_020565280.1 leucine-rich repeat-containing protein 18 [Oryzias latipes]
MSKGKGAKGAKQTLKSAKKAIQITPDGKRRLVLSNMGLTVFPKCLFKLTNLDELDLSRNLLQKLPDSIGNFSSLTRLDLHSNKLESLPESVGNLTGLTHLNLANNCLTFVGLPFSLGCLTNLKSLNLGMNQLDDLPPPLENLVNLQELGLFDNRFLKLPEFVKVLRNLTKLNLKRNPLEHTQGNEESMKNRKLEAQEEAYLVHESILCRMCLTKYKAQKENLVRDGDMSKEKKKRTFSGLMTPNSVAILSQNEWRLKTKQSKDYWPSLC